ncbi:putative CmcJ-like methyltransferase [Emericellopsis atlantica]|uniref:CmcJ-like methyltransferase n=1 Tax=Emericellopsis atlantica TaxID=2614577 RepID=A0A9P7ZES9_9HYPO|nr:putative CmcJ-like methyltransferase [Emericellopsis atlantica]KAG9250322.1 putative CmcJ-like methyltransferase [Emericellopsis atlantica]
METHIQYIIRDPILRVEKAFTTDFPIDHVNGVEGIRMQNIHWEKRQVIVEEIVDPRSWKLDVHGFCFLRAETRLDPEKAYKQKDEVKDAFWHEIEAILHHHFPQYSRIEAFDFTLRKRDPEYPVKNRGYNPEYENPSGGAHADFSQQGGPLVLQHCFQGQDKFWEGKDFDMINVWRPLRGPTDDWPLAMCDYTSISTNDDLVLNDAIKRDLVVECSLMHHSDTHRWHYLKDHDVDTLLVFRNSDSLGKRARGFHAAVCNPNTTGPPRESVEVRLVAFY